MSTFNGGDKMGRKRKKYNIEMTIDCLSNEDAKSLADFILFSGFLPLVDGTMISVVAKNVDSMHLEYLVDAVEGDKRVIGSSFHKTPF
jgi:hypothetical protein